MCKKIKNNIIHNLGETSFHLHLEVALVSRLAAALSVSLSACPELVAYHFKSLFERGEVLVCGGLLLLI